MSIDKILAEVERLDAKATPGPWLAFRNRHPETNGGKWGWIEGSGVTLGYYSTNRNTLAEVNASLLATYRTAAPLLAAEVRRLRACAAAVGSVLSANGCDCDCDCDSDGHSDECEVCLGCRIERAMKVVDNG